jgi:hypothetical protein
MASQPPQLHLNPGLSEFLRRLQRAEASASGPARRSALRHTRDAIGAALATGVPGRELADCLGVSVGAIRNRAARHDSTITADEITELTGSSVAALTALTQQPLTPAGTEDAGYRVAEVVRALLEMRTR